MSNLTLLPVRSVCGDVHVIVETPRGSRVKIKYEPSFEAFTLAHELMSGLIYPFDFGFIPSTMAEDGDPLDAVIMHDASMPPGLVLCCTPVGVVEIIQREPERRVRNDRILVVPKGGRSARTLTDARKLPHETKREIEKFFSASVALQNKKLKFLEWGGPGKAEKLIKKAERHAA